MQSWMDAPDMNNLTALYYAVEKGYGEICFRLLMAKANPNVLDQIGASPLHVASQRNYDGILMLLIDFGGDFQISNNLGNTPLHIAALRNSDRCVKYLLKRGANRNALNTLNETPLNIAELFRLDDTAECIRTFNDKNIEPPPKEPCPITPQDSLIVNNVLKALEFKHGFQIEPSPISIANQTVIERNLLKKERSRMIYDSSRDPEDAKDIFYLNSRMDILECRETVIDMPLSDKASLQECRNGLQNAFMDNCIKSNVISSLQIMRSQIDSFYIGETSSNLEDLLYSFTVLENSLQELLNFK